MLRSFAIIVLWVGLAAGAAMALCHLLGADGISHQILLAACASALGAGLGLIPLRIGYRSSPSSVAQLALAGTVLHLLFIGIVAVVPALMHRQSSLAFLLSLMGLYWVSLAGLALACVRAVRSAAMIPPGAVSSGAVQ